MWCFQSHRICANNIIESLKWATSSGFILHWKFYMSVVIKVPKVKLSLIPYRLYSSPQLVVLQKLTFLTETGKSILFRYIGRYILSPYTIYNEYPKTSYRFIYNQDIYFFHLKRKSYFHVLRSFYQKKTKEIFLNSPHFYLLFYE